jgi:hypothetical protein
MERLRPTRHYVSRPLGERCSAAGLAVTDASNLDEGLANFRLGGCVENAESVVLVYDGSDYETYWKARLAFQKECPAASDFVGVIEEMTTQREYLTAVAIKRHGEVHVGDKRYGHKFLRDSLDPYYDPQDVEGFVTSAGRFVDRREAKSIAVVAGQIRSGMSRELLSSDVNWKPRP